MAPHQTPIQVRFAELDPYGHVNHAVYVSYFEVGRTTALADIDLGIDQLAREGYQFVVVDLNVHYRRAAGAAEHLVIETEVLKVSRATSVWSQRIVRPAADGRDAEVLVTAELRVGVTDRRGRPTKPPAWIAEKLAPLLA